MKNLISTIKVGKHGVLALLFSLAGMSSYAQQDAMFSQYMFNMLPVNPAYAGTSNVINFAALRRWQWVGIEGAPRTLTVSADAPFLKERMGLGITFINDQIGVTKSNSAYVSYSYRIKFLSGGTLSFGLQGGFANYQANLASLFTTQIGDPTFSSNINSWLPNVGGGLYYSTERFYAGISAPHLINNALSPGTPSVQRRHYFAMTGYVFHPSANFAVKPSLLAKYVEGSPLQLDFNFNVWYHDKISAGISYRTGDAIVGMLQFMPTNQLRIGYAYDFTLTQLQTYNSGSHELMIGYTLAAYNKDRIVTPRYF